LKKWLLLVGVRRLKRLAAALLAELVRCIQKTTPLLRSQPEKAS
jgi:hypothetical protein